MIAEVSGAWTNRATMEIKRGDRPVERLEMASQENGQFLLNVNVDEEPIEYRIYAGDGVTERFTLQSRVRPYVTAFRKTYQYPEYTQLKSATVQEETGHLKALAGSRAKVEFTIDQPVASAQVNVYRPGSDQIETVEAKLVDGNRVVAEIPIGTGGVYKVQLVAAETKFENTFSPKYEITALADLSPRADLGRAIGPDSFSAAE